MAIVIGLAATVAALLSSRTALFNRWEKQAEDLIYRNFASGQAFDGVVIIAVDQNSLDYFQENLQLLWPWPRDVYALATDFLSDCGAKVIAFDVIFSAPDIDRLNVSAAYADSRFAEAMQQSGKVVLATQLEDSTYTGKPGIIERFNLECRYTGDQRIVYPYPGLTLPIRRFQEAMAMPGAVNFFTDEDGICRRIPLVFQYGDRIITYMALSAYMVSTGDSLIQAEQGRLSLHNRTIPIDKNGKFEIYWYGAGGPGNTFTYVSFAQLLNSYLQLQQGLEPDISPEIFRDKAVFIGATAAGLLDLKTTPFSPLEPYPGVEIYATIYSNILQGDYIRHVSAVGWFIVILLTTVGLGIVWQRLSIWKAALLSLCVFAIPAVVAIILFQSRHCFFPMVSSDLAIVLAVMAVLIVNYLTEGREKAQVKRIFNRYLHPAVVETLTQNPENVEMGGREIEATVLFTDLQDFTSTSELFTPQQIVELLNEYFGLVETIIFQHDGMLDKYTGDGIMAVFGAPIESENHALHSARAVIGFQKLSKMTIEKAEKPVQFTTRVGVNSGCLIVGNIGSPNRMDYTAIGDTVNLAARLEGVNKIYGTQNLISETTYELIKTQMICREIDHIRVKGRDAALRIYTIIGEMDIVDNKLKEALSLHDDALKLYRQRDYENAILRFQEVLQLVPSDRVAQVFVCRCSSLLDNPGLIDAEGIFNITVK